MTRPRASLSPAAVATSVPGAARPASSTGSFVPAPAPGGAGGALAPRTTFGRRSRGGLLGHWKLALALATVWIIWGSTFLGIRVMVETIPPLLGSGLRFLLGGLVLGAVVLRGQGHRAFVLSADEWRGSAAMGLLLVAGGVGLVALAESHHVPSALAALIASAEAAIVLGLRVAVGRERISAATAISVGIGLIGVAILLLPGSRPAGIPLWAMLLALAGSVTWAIGTFAGSRMVTARRLLVGITIQMLAGGTILIAAGLVTGERLDLGAVSTGSAIAFAGLTAASVAVYVAYGWLLRNASLSLVTTQCYVNPLVAVALGALVLHERLSGTAAIGMAITIAAVALVLRTERSSGGGTADGAMTSAGERPLPA